MVILGITNISRAEEVALRNNFTRFCDFWNSGNSVHIHINNDPREWSFVAPRKQTSTWYLAGMKRPIVVVNRDEEHDIGDAIDEDLNKDSVISFTFCKVSYKSLLFALLSFYQGLAKGKGRNHITFTELNHGEICYSLLTNLARGDMV